jgi:hypothetical protein
VGIGTSNPAYPLEVVGTTQVGALNVGTTSFTSNSITMLNKATDKFTIGASNIEIDGNIIKFKNNTPRIVCSNNGTANAQVILYRNQNFNTPNQSSTGLGFQMVNDGFGSSYTNLYNSGSSNGSNTGYQPICIMGSKFGVAKSNPAYECDVAGTTHATTIREGTILLGEKYALSNTLSNALSNINSNIATLSNYITPKAEWSSNSLSNFSTGASYTTFSNWISPIGVYGSNAHSNHTLLTTYNTFSNYITPKAEWTSNSLSNFSSSASYTTFSNYITPKAEWGCNALSNYTTLTTYNAFSNYITPKSEWASNALSNYTPLSLNRFWTFSNPVVITSSNTQINTSLLSSLSNTS